MIKGLISIKFLETFNILPILSSLKIILCFLGIGLTLYAFSIFLIVVFSLLRVKAINTLKVVHILSVMEVYAFICFIIGIILTFGFYGIITLKILLLSLMVIVNGITVTRLIAKTSYFYNMHSKNKS